MVFDWRRRPPFRERRGIPREIIALFFSSPPILGTRCVRNAYIAVVDTGWTHLGTFTIVYYCLPREFPDGEKGERGRNDTIARLSCVSRRNDDSTILIFDTGSFELESPVAPTRIETIVSIDQTCAFNSRACHAWFILCVNAREDRRLIASFCFRFRFRECTRIKSALYCIIIDARKNAYLHYLSCIIGVRKIRRCNFKERTLSSKLR